jgi:glycosyltransferase involved in cell wall biosynthesis
LLFAEASVQRWLGSYEAVDLFCAPSRFLADSITSRRFPAERVRVLYNGVDTEAIAPAFHDEGYVLYMGRLSKEKGVHTLLRSWAEAGMPAKLVIAGTGPLAEELRSRYPVAEFAGHLSGTRLNQVIAGAALVVVPSELYENCSMSILEAMAWGKPVVASRIGGNPELVLDGETGLLFEAGDGQGLSNAIGSLLKDRDYLRTLGRAARRRVEQLFSLKRHNEGLLAVYKSVLSL